MGAVTFSVDPELVDFFVEQLATEIFVETGTYEGESIAIAADRIGECHSVELSEKYFEAAQRRFADRPNVRLSLGESPDFLRRLAPQLKGRRVFYWLDAHWCVAEGTAGEDSQSPLLEEIDAIGSAGAQSVICIDDARLFMCPPPAPHRYTDWPDFSSLLSALQRSAAEHRVMILNDVIIAYPPSVDAALRRFAFDHGIDWLHLANLVLRAPPTEKTKRKRWFWR